jgi:putative DNA primase/helicase
MNGADIASSFGLRRTSFGWSGNCPACSYPNAFRLIEKDGRALWACFACQDRVAVTEAVMGRCVSGATSARHAAIKGHDVTKTQQAMRLWQAAQPIEGSPAALYLNTRGLGLPDGLALRYSPDAYHPTGVRAGCMIALAVDTCGKAQAVHRTYVAPGGAGKANLDPPRATLGPLRGAVVRLCELHGSTRLVIGEGIESSLSAGLLASAPAWAALSAGNMAMVTLPDTVAEVIVAADHDAPGLRAAWAAADMFLAQGRRVQVICPNRPGEDFNDLLQRQMSGERNHG